MIIPMKKIHVIVQKKGIVSALENLRDLGTVHVEHQEALTGYQLTERREEVSILTQALDILKATKVVAEQKECADWTESVNKVLELSAEIEHFIESINKRKVQISQWEVWGHFDPQDIKGLEAKGIYIQLCQYSAKEQVMLSEYASLKVINKTGDLVRAVVIAQEKVELPYEMIALPAMGLNTMQALQEKENGKIEEAREKIREEVCHIQSLEKSLAECRSILEFEEVEKGMRENI